MESVTANLHILFEMNPTAYSCTLQGFPTVLQLAVFWSDVVCLITGMNRGKRWPKSDVCNIQTPNDWTERTSCDIRLTKSLGCYMRYTSKIKSCCTVSITIPNVMTVKTQTFFVHVDQAYIIDATCLHVVHIKLQHRTSHPTTMSTPDTMVSAAKKNLSPHPADIYRITTHQSTWPHHQANECKSGLETERVRGPGALHSLSFKKKFAAEKWQETHCLSYE